MVCKEIEMGKLKCKRYWPESKDEKLNFAGVDVSLVCLIRTVHCVIHPSPSKDGISFLTPCMTVNLPVHPAHRKTIKFCF